MLHKILTVFTAIIVGMIINFYLTPEQAMQNNNKPQNCTASLCSTERATGEAMPVPLSNSNTNKTSDIAQKSAELPENKINNTINTDTINDQSPMSVKTIPENKTESENKADINVENKKRTVNNPTAQNLEYIEQKIYENINNERKNKNISLVKRNKTIDKATEIRISEIKTLYNHTRPNGKSFASVLNDVKYGDEYTHSYSKNGVLINETIYDFGSASENFTSCLHINSWNTKDMPEFTGTAQELDYVADYITEQFINSKKHYEAMIDKQSVSVGISVGYEVLNENNSNEKCIKFYCVEIFTTK